VVSATDLGSGIELLWASLRSSVYVLQHSNIATETGNNRVWVVTAAVARASRLCLLGLPIT
jgi:hypothetical protein